MDLSILGPLAETSDYKKSSDYKKICQIVSQYQEKYEKDLGNI